LERLLGHIEWTYYKGTHDLMGAKSYIGFVLGEIVLYKLFYWPSSAAWLATFLVISQLEPF
jgi:hypothetical protein